MVSSFFVDGVFIAEMKTQFLEWTKLEFDFHFQNN